MFIYNIIFVLIHKLILIFYISWHFFPDVQISVENICNADFASFSYYIVEREEQFSDFCSVLGFLLEQSN